MKNGRVIKSVRVGDFFVVGGRVERITEFTRGSVRNGLLVGVPVEKMETPRLTEDFFKRNDFKEEGEGRFRLGDDSAFILATKRDECFIVVIKNGPFYFMGPIDEVNELLHAADSCAITSEFVCA